MEDKKLNVVILGAGIVGVLAAYELMKTNKINSITMLDKNFKGGNYCQNVGIKWFYSEESFRFFKELKMAYGGIEYMLKYHVGSIYHNGKFHIYPTYLINNVELIKEYGDKTRNGKYNGIEIMNMPFFNKMENRIYFYVNERHIYGVLIKILKEFGTEMLSVSGWETINSIDVYNRIISYGDRKIHYDFLINTIPFTSMIGYTNVVLNSLDVPSDSFNTSEYTKRRKVNYVISTKPYYGKNQEDIWWDYVYLPSAIFKARRINAVRRKFGLHNHISYVVEFIHGNDRDIVIDEFYNVTKLKDALFGDTISISGFIDDRYAQTVKVIQNLYKIFSFGRNATLDKREMINNSYDNIIEFAKGIEKYV